MEALGGERRYSFYSFLTSALERWELASRPGCALPREKVPPVPIGQEAGWSPEPVWTLRLEKNPLPLAGDRPQSPDRPVHSQTLLMTAGIEFKNKKSSGMVYRHMPAHFDHRSYVWRRYSSSQKVPDGHVALLFITLVTNILNLISCWAISLQVTHYLRSNSIHAEVSQTVLVCWGFPTEIYHF
jgi:hypothetical protein